VAKLFDSQTGARVVIASDDHCPPHAHARHRAEGWVVRLRFSFSAGNVGIMSVAPTENSVRQRQLNQMLNEMSVNLRQLRTVWWNGKMTTCLENQWLVRLATGRFSVRNERLSGARQVRCAGFEVMTGTTVVTCMDGTEHLIAGEQRK
jgi:hypothetical protein